MLRKLLPDYPEDVIRRSFQYQYRKSIDVYSVTTHEAELLTRINSHHSRWTYSRQPFTQLDEIVRVSDFLPFYEHLRYGFKSGSSVTSTTVHTLRQLLPQPQQIGQRSSDFMTNKPTILRGQSTVSQGTSVPMPSYSLSTDLARENISSTSRPAAPAPAPNVSRPPQQPKPVENPYAVLLPQRPSQNPPPQQPQSTPTLSNNTINFASIGKE